MASFLRRQPGYRINSHELLAFNKRPQLVWSFFESNSPVAASLSGSAKVADQLSGTGKLQAAFGGSSGFHSNLQGPFGGTIGLTGFSQLSLTLAGKGVAETYVFVPQSHTTQELLNYFDDHDVRVRQLPYSIDAQLLNVAAVSMDTLAQRLARETAAGALETCPAAIDNGGCYYQVPVDSTVDPSTITTVQGMRNNQWIPLRAYDDTCPVPASYELDTARNRIYLPSPQLFDSPGGDVIEFGPFDLAIPNKLSFWIDVDVPVFAAEILIEGERYPKPVWADQQHQSSEAVLVSLQGAVQSTITWVTISRIVVRGLPATGRIRCWQIPVAVPAVADSDRPFAHHNFRYVRFPRYWQIANNLLQEMYMEDNLGGLAYAQSYGLQAPLTDVAVEPYTWGAVAVGGTKVYYFDRRQPVPSNLAAAALKQEPLYGLECVYDQTKPVRSVAVIPVAYGGASLMQRWRYVVQQPDNQLFALLPNGAYAPYSGGAGWQIGTPTAVSMPLVQTGTYVISIECLDQNGALTYDSFPYPNLAFSPTVFDLSALVPDLQGVAYDSLQQLWLWTGTYLVPVVPRYDSYVIDTDTRSLYLTDAFDQIQYA